MQNESVFILSVTILILFFNGDPDLMDGIISFLTEKK